MGVAREPVPAFRFGNGALFLQGRIRELTNKGRSKAHGVLAHFMMIFMTVPIAFRH